MTDNIYAEKKRIREYTKNIRLAFSTQKKAEYDEAITRQVLLLREYRENQKIFLYISKDIEVDTSAIVKKALADGKIVAAPKCIPKMHLMDFYRITSVSQLKKGYYGILEPDPSVCTQITDFSDGLCIVPGLAFDFQGYRLGFGMGYYDRFLNNFSGTTVGICYCDCVRKELPHGYFDRNVRILITERYIKKFS